MNKVLIEVVNSPGCAKFRASLEVIKKFVPSTTKAYYGIQRK